MRKMLSILMLSVIVFTLGSCSDDDNENMLWEIVSISDPEFIKVVNETTDKFDSPSQLWVQAGYKSGEVVLRCTNHPIAFSLIGPNDSYTNPEMGFTISKVDDNTLKITFVEDASGKEEATDQIAVTNADRKPVVCNTLLWIYRTFGELSPTE